MAPLSPLAFTPKRFLSVFFRRSIVIFLTGWGVSFVVSLLQGAPLGLAAIALFTRGSGLWIILAALSLAGGALAGAGLLRAPPPRGGASPR